MLKIFICEDNPNHKEKFEKMINNIIMIEDYDMQIELSTDDPHNIINNIHIFKTYNISTL